MCNRTQKCEEATLQSYQDCKGNALIRGPSNLVVREVMILPSPFTDLHHNSK